MREEKLREKKIVNMYFVSMMEYMLKNKNVRKVKKRRNSKKNISGKRKIKEKRMELS